MVRKRTYNVDFNELESSSYSGQSDLRKEILDKMVEISLDKQEEKEGGLSERQEALWKDLKQSLRLLTKRQQEVISMYYGLNTPQLTEPQIAKKLGISQVAVSKIRSRAINRLKNLNQSN